MNGPMKRKLMVGLAVAAAILIPAVQQMAGLGLSQSAFAAQGDATLQAAGYAFSIWGLIYLGLAVYAVRYAKGAETLALQMMAGPAALAIFGCGVWIMAASANLMALTVAIILVSFGAALTAIFRGAPLAVGGDRTFALWPIALLAGWLTIAAPLNVVTVLTAMQIIAPAPVWAFGAIALVLAVGATIAWRTGLWIYPLPIAWGLGGVYVAERAEKPEVAIAAAVAAVLLLVAAGMASRRTHPHER